MVLVWAAAAGLLGPELSWAGHVLNLQDTQQCQAAPRVRGDEGDRKQRCSVGFLESLGSHCQSASGRRGH